MNRGRQCECFFYKCATKFVLFTVAKKPVQVLFVLLANLFWIYSLQVWIFSKIVPKEPWTFNHPEKKMLISIPEQRSLRNLWLPLEPNIRLTLTVCCCPLVAGLLKLKGQAYSEGLCILEHKWHLTFVSWWCKGMLCNGISQNMVIYAWELDNVVNFPFFFSRINRA